MHRPKGFRWMTSRLTRSSRRSCCAPSTSPIARWPRSHASCTPAGSSCSSSTSARTRPVQPAGRTAWRPRGGTSPQAVAAIATLSPRLRPQASQPSTTTRNGRACRRSWPRSRSDVRSRSQPDDRQRPQEPSPLQPPPPPRDSASSAKPPAPPCRSEPYTPPSPCWNIEGHRVCGVVAHPRAYTYPDGPPVPLNERHEDCGALLRQVSQLGPYVYFRTKATGIGSRSSSRRSASVCSDDVDRDRVDFPAGTSFYAGHLSAECMRGVCRRFEQPI